MLALRLIPIATLVLAACGESQKPTPTMQGSGSAQETGSAGGPETPVPTEDDAVLEAVFLHEIAAAKPAAGDAICLRVRTASGATGDASPALLAAILRLHPSAVAASKCGGGGHDPVRVLDPAGPAVMFDIGPVVRDAMGIRVVGGGGHRGGGSIMEREYTLQRGGDTYAVISERVLRQN